MTDITTEPTTTTTTTTQTTGITTPTTTTTDDDDTTTTTSGIHAVLRNRTTQSVITLTTRTRTELAKLLETMTDHEVLRVYKGKELTINEKVTFTFN